MRSLILSVLILVLLAVVALECRAHLSASEQAGHMSDEWKSRWEADTKQTVQQQKTLDELLAKDQAEIARQEQLIKDLHALPRSTSAAAVHQ